MCLLEYLDELKTHSEMKLAERYTCRKPGKTGRGKEKQEDHRAHQEVIAHRAQ